MTEVLGQGKFLRLLNDDGWEFVDRSLGSGVVAIVAVHDDKIILVEQFRHSVKRNVIELPAGLVGDVGAESLADAAHRELIEETGFAAKRLTVLTEGPPSSGLSTEVVTIFLAEELTRVSAGGGDATENITVHEVALATAATWLNERAKRGVYLDPKVFAGLYFASRKGRA